MTSTPTAITVFLLLLLTGCANLSSVCAAEPASPRTTAKNSKPAIEPAGPGRYKIGPIFLDQTQRTISLPGQVNLTDQILEYALVTEDGKTHESLLSTRISPRDLHLALLLLSAKPSPDLGPTNQVCPVPAGSAVTVEVTWELEGKVHREQLQRCFGLAPRETLSITGQLAQVSWLYNGSVTQEGRFAAEEEGSIIALIRDPAAILNNPGIDRDDDDIHVADRTKVPPKGTPVTIVLHLPPSPPNPKGAKP